MQQTLTYHSLVQPTLYLLLLGDMGKERVWGHGHTKFVLPHIYCGGQLPHPLIRSSNEFINRKDNTVVFLSNEPKSLSLCSVYLINSNATVITPNNLVQAILFYYITKKMTFITISKFIQINSVKSQLLLSRRLYNYIIQLIIATWTYKANNTMTKKNKKKL